MGQGLVACALVPLTGCQTCPSFPPTHTPQLKSLGIDNIMKFEWLAPPPAEAMVRAMETLHALGVLDEDAK